METPVTSLLFFDAPIDTTEISAVILPLSNDLGVIRQS